MDKELKCRQCRQLLNENLFIDLKGKVLKTCKNCRYKDSIRKNYTKYRERKRAENKEEFLKHNAEMARIWRSKNKEHLAKWQTKNFKARFRAIKQQAQKKGIVWNENLTDEICFNLMMSKCAYCNYLSKDTLNGLDRVDSNKSYELKNIVACCKICNFMKGSLDGNTFVKRCKHISYLHYGPGEINENVWKNSKSVSYKSYESRAIKKKLEFALTKDQFLELINNDCYYCKRKTNENNINGVDRKDNKFGYIFENCISCCSECNQMKNILSDIEFINKCKDVSNYCIDNNVVFENINECLKRITKREKVEIKKEKINIISCQEKEIKEHAKHYILLNTKKRVQ